MKKITVPLKEINGVIGELRFPVNVVDELRFLNESPFLIHPIIETADSFDPKEIKKVIKSFAENGHDGELTIFMKRNMTLISIKIFRKNGIITLQTRTRA